MFRAFKVELKTNNKQASMLCQALGNARFSYNWALEIKRRAFESKTKIPNNIELHRQINLLKKTDYPFLYLASKTCVQNALRDCDKAFKNFFDRCKKKVKAKGFPKFKSKKNEKQSFRVDGAILVESDYVKLPRIGKLKLAEQDYIPTDCKILSATLSKRAGKWFVSIQVESPDREHSDVNNEVNKKNMANKFYQINKESTTDVWLTPPSLITSLGEFDLDPCSPNNLPWKTAKEFYSLENRQDGLALDWKGRVWLNPPYSNWVPFMEKLKKHQNGIALIFARTETKGFFDHVWNDAHSIL